MRHSLLWNSYFSHLSINRLWPLIRPVSARHSEKSQCFGAELTKVRLASSPPNPFISTSGNAYWNIWHYNHRVKIVHKCSLPTKTVCHVWLLPRLSAICFLLWLLAKNGFLPWLSAWLCFLLSHGRKHKNEHAQQEATDRGQSQQNQIWQSWQKPFIQYQVTFEWHFSCGLELFIWSDNNCCLDK